jgi:hypothetical protein
VERVVLKTQLLKTENALKTEGDIVPPPFSLKDIRRFAQQVEEAGD